MRFPGSEHLARGHFGIYGVVALVTLVAVLGLLGPSPARLSVLQDAPAEARALYERVGNTFRRDSTGTLLVVHSKAPFTGAQLALIGKIAVAVERHKDVEKVVTPADLDLLVPGAAAAFSGPDDATRQAAFQKVRGHPLLVGQLISEDGCTVLLPVMTPPEMEGRRSGMLDALSEAAHAVASGSGLTTEVTGPIPLMISRNHAFDRDHERFRIIGFGVTVLIALLLFRGLTPVLIVSLAPAVGVLWTFGIIYALSINLNGLILVILPVMLMMVGFTDSVHLMLEFRRQRADHGPKGATAIAVRALLAPCFLTSLTTGVGFASLLLTSSRAIGDFAMASVIGIACTFFSVVLLVPMATRSPLGRRILPRKKNAKRWAPLFDSLERGFQRVVLDHARTVSVLGVLAAVVLAWVATFVHADSRLRDDLPSESPAAVALATVDDAVGGIQLVHALVAWPKDVPDTTVWSVLLELEESFEAEALTRHPLSARSLSVALGGTRFERMLSLPSIIRHRVWRPDLREALVSARVPDSGIATHRAAFARLEKRFSEIAKAHGVEVQLTGAPVIHARHLFRLIEDLMASLGVAALVIWALLWIVLRSFRIGVLAVIPNFLPLMAAGAVLVFLDEPLTHQTVCAFTICLGIAVDDTIHFVLRHQREKALGLTGQAALTATFRHVGGALVVTTFIMLAGFATILTSELPAHRTFGAMSCVTLIAALCGDLIILPALLHAFGEPRKSVAS